jgi:hypothetical protein
MKSRRIQFDEGAERGKAAHVVATWLDNDRPVVSLNLEQHPYDMAPITLSKLRHRTTDIIPTKPCLKISVARIVTLISRVSIRN